MPYTAAERERLRSELVAAARADARISGGALTGSATVGLEDEWSDIDLAFGLREAGDLPEALGDWTRLMYDRHQAVHHVDVTAGAFLYRVFLLRSTLQVDLAFAPAPEFGPRAPTFRLLFGTAAETPHVPPPAAEHLIGWAWLYAIHARSCIARGKWWQAEHMVSGLRDHVLALACLRLGFPTAHGRGFDRLPSEVLDPLRAAFPSSLDAASLGHALQVALRVLAGEMRLVDPALAERVEPVLRELGEPPPHAARA